jgi:hypothetical protein
MNTFLYQPEATTTQTTWPYLKLASSSVRSRFGSRPENQARPFSDGVGVFGRDARVREIVEAAMARRRRRGIGST